MADASDPNADYAAFQQKQLAGAPASGLQGGAGNPAQPSQSLANTSPHQLAGHIAKAMSHEMQGHEGDYENCVDCGTANSTQDGTNAEAPAQPEQNLSKTIKKALGVDDPKAAF